MNSIKKRAKVSKILVRETCGPIPKPNDSFIEINLYALPESTYYIAVFYKKKFQETK